MNIQERVEVAILNKYYGKMLTNKQQEILAMYVDNNLSLAEVSEELNISRQAVKDAIDNAVQTLKNFEDKMGIIARDKQIKKEIESIENEKIKLKLLALLED